MSRTLSNAPRTRSSRDRAVVQVLTLHEQVGAPRIAAERCDLAPQSPIDEGAVEVGDGLALDHPVAHGVVADRERDEVDVGASLDEKRRHVRPPLAHVNGYRHLIHEQALSKRKRAPCVPTVPQA